jgi:peptidoglycan DL-endopeptidase RipA
MASPKTNVAIWTAVIAAAATIIAALIANSHDGGHQDGTTTTTTTTSANPGSGVVRLPPDTMSAWVYAVPVQDPKHDRIGELSDGQQVEIVCTKQGPALTGTNGTSTVWDRIKYGSGYGFIPDANLDTGTNAPVA